MADLSNISLSSNVGDVSQGHSGNFYQRPSSEKKKEAVPSKLRVGEIVRGTISERINDEIAFVRIPTGTFKAFVSKNLEKGDSLHFKVIETSPNLILKVYEVSTTFNGKELSANDLLRILDLPNINLYMLLIEKMRKSRRTILREDALDIYKIVSKGEKEFLSKTNLDNLLTQLNEMQKAKLPLSYNLINKLIPLFIDENKISYNLNVLSENLVSLPEIYRVALGDIFSDIRNNSYKKNNLFVLKLSKNQNSISFFDALCDISELDISIEIKNAAIVIRDLIASMSLWNIISFSGKTPFHYIIPYFYEGEYYIIRIVKQTINKSSNSAVSFVFSMPTQNFGEIRTKVIGFQRQLKVYLEAESDKIISTLEHFRSGLEKAVSSKNFKLESLKIGLEDIESELNDISKSNSGDHFTLVV